MVAMAAGSEIETMLVQNERSPHTRHADSCEFRGPFYSLPTARVEGS